jgi:serine/threonine protein kinase
MRAGGLSLLAPGLPGPMSPRNDLKAVLRRETVLGTARALAVVSQLADLLDAAHRGGFVHGDVQPSAVLLDREDGREQCRLARTAAAGAQPIGSVGYVAPEQVRGDPLDGRADQYGLTCLLFECLTGTVPFGRRSDLAAIFAHLEEAPPAASERGRDLPRAIDSVLARGLAKRPEERYGSCAALVAAASEALGGARLRPWRRCSM